MDIRFQNLGPEHWTGEVMLAPVCQDEALTEVCPQIDKAAPWLVIAPALRDFKGKAGELAILHGHPDLSVPRVLAVGLGPREKVDTAGIRRKRAIEDETVERYSVIRSLGAIRRADVVLIVIDAAEGLSEQDVRIAGYVHEEGKASVVIVNKWDVIEKDTNTMNKFKKELTTDLAFMSYVPMLFISAKTGQRVNKVLETAKYAYTQNSMRISTGTLNDVISEAVTVTAPPSDKGRQLKIYYAVQFATNPPTFAIVVNDPKIMHFSYQRYLENYIRKSFSLDATPIRIKIRQRGKNDKLNDKA